MSNTKKIIAIVGATGSQGGGLARAILREGDKSEFAVRALVRDPHSHNAEALRKWGAEIVQCDVNDEASLVSAVQGAYGMYCVTFFWELMDPEKEKRQAYNMATAAKFVFA